ncbi:MAG: hypothetical protein ABIG67_01830 [Pseudomonadota bacterium]
MKVPLCKGGFRGIFLKLTALGWTHYTVRFLKNLITAYYFSNTPVLQHAIVCCFQADHPSLTWSGEAVS